MRKSLWVVIVLLALVISTIASAGIWTSINSLTLREVKPSKTYALDVVGLNVRVYEFDTQEEPVHHCVVIFTESKYKAPVMQCWKK
ncbi:hypothetical protein [Desulfonauticus submarinus]